MKIIVEFEERRRFRVELDVAALPRHAQEDAVREAIVKKPIDFWEHLGPREIAILSWKKGSR